MRKRFLLSLLVALLTTLSTRAYDFQSGDLYYNITSGTTVKVTSGDYSTLATATIPATVTYNGTSYSVTSIGDYAFKDCSSLTSITIPNSVTSIGNYAFNYCSSLTSITIPNSVTSIGEGAFCSCSSLTSITIPNSVTNISSGAFSDCISLPVVDHLRYADTYLVEAVDKSLSTYTIKAGTKWIGDEAFSSCSSLTSITIPNSVTSIEFAAFYSCSSLTSITIGNSVTGIGYGAFYKCSALTSITIPNSVTDIASYAFYDCSSLTSITIGNSVSIIGGYAFYDCSSLTSITIGNSVTIIGDYAFAECSKLGDIYCYATTPPMCHAYTFDGVSKNCNIYVPLGTVQDYQLATFWSDFFYYYEIEEEEQAIQTAEQENKPSRKILRDGQVLILRNGETYDMMGQRM